MIYTIMGHPEAARVATAIHEGAVINNDGSSEIAAMRLDDVPKWNNLYRLATIS
jgi:hypothetical protein